MDDEVKWLRSMTASENSVDVCGGAFKEAGFNIPVVIETIHQGPSAKVSFSTNIRDDPCVKSLGIDNVEIYVK